jgi:energy-coupling factor transporter ATP-binding protein EcfA2
LSGGQRKRVNVGVELISTPCLLLLDEPTTGLDYLNEQTVVRSLQKLAQQGRTVVFVTHSLASLELVDHVVLIHAGKDGGRVQGEGPPEQLRQRLGLRTWAEVFRPPAERPPRRGTSAGAHAGLGGWRGRLPPLGILALRYLRLWTSSPWSFTASLLLLPLVLGLLVRLAVATDGSLGTDRLLLGLIACFWLGMNQSVREVVKERDIFLREHAVHVGSGAYLLSKALVFGVIAVPQAVLLTLPLKFLAIEQWSVGFDLRELTCPWLVLLPMFWLADLLGVLLGLLLSALCLFVRHKGEVVAVLLVILVTLPQLLFCAKLLPDGRLAREPEHYRRFVLWHDTAHFPELLSYATVSRYLYLPLDALVREVPAVGKVFAFNLTVLATFGLCVIVLTWLTLEVYTVDHKRIR